MPARAASVALARRLAQAQLTCWGIAGDALDTATLVVSELVTNAVLHTTSELIVCELRDGAERLRLTVQDQGHGAGIPEATDALIPEEERGRGLLLVAALSSSWGARDVGAGAGLVVWAELPQDGASCTGSQAR